MIGVTHVKYPAITQSLSANRVYSSGNLVIYKQTNTQIGVVSEQQHVL